MSQESIAVPILLSEKIEFQQTTITEVQRKLALEEMVKISELPKMSSNVLHILNTAGVRTVKELIFISNAKLAKAFSMKGSVRTRKYIRRINAALYKQGFPRRMSVRQYQERVEELRSMLQKA